MPFGYMRCGEATTATVNTYIAQRLKAGTKPAPINRELAALKRAFRLASRDGLMMDTPYIPMLREANARQGFFEADQLTKVIDHLPPYVRPVSWFAAITGWRISHDVRRTALRVMVRAGISQHTAMMMSGHKTVSVFRRCDVVSDADLAEAARKLDAATKQPQTPGSGLPEAAGNPR